MTNKKTMLSILPVQKKSCYEISFTKCFATEGEKQLA